MARGGDVHAGIAAELQHAADPDGGYGPQPGRQQNVTSMVGLMAYAMLRFDQATIFPEARQDCRRSTMKRQMRRTVRHGIAEGGGYQHKCKGVSPAMDRN